MLAIFARIKPALRKSITFDNDTAFAQHGLLQSMRDMATWFCDAYASWQKGGVENAIDDVASQTLPPVKQRTLADICREKFLTPSGLQEMDLLLRKLVSGSSINR